MALGGWRTVAMVMRYAHVNASNLAPGVMQLGKIRGLPKRETRFPTETR